MRKLNYILGIGFIALLFSCDTDDNITTKSEFVQQPFSLNMEGVIKLYSAATDTKINGRTMSTEVPSFEELVYTLSVLRNDGSGGYQYIKEVYFTFEELNNSQTFVLDLEQNVEHFFDFGATYMLTSNDIDKGLDEGLSFGEIQVTNSFEEGAEVDTIVSVLNFSQEASNFTFGIHNLGWIFGFSSDFIIPNPVDTVSFNLNNEQPLTGPRLFDINVENTVNASLLGNVTLEFIGGNSEVMEVSLDTIPDELFIAYDNLSKIEVFYTAPTSTRTSIMQKATGLGGYDLTFYVLNVIVPEILTDSEGEFVSAISPGTEFLEILFSEKLYTTDTINFGG